MKVTVSNTSMMKPILHTRSTSYSAQKHPHRIVGLLDISQKHVDKESTALYVRTNKSNCNATPMLWRSFLQTPDPQSQLCAAVFGFEFDGETTWYQLWNVETNQAYWLAHEDNMDYQPYSIMTMDALVTLIPEWDGELHLALTSSCDSSSINNSVNSAFTSNSTQSQNQERHVVVLSRSDKLLISDAATTADGQLWFLVTVQDVQLKTDQPICNRHLHTGWISQNNATTSAA